MWKPHGNGVLFPSTTWGMQRVALAVPLSAAPQQPLYPAKAQQTVKRTAVGTTVRYDSEIDRAIPCIYKTVHLSLLSDNGYGNSKNSGLYHGFLFRWSVCVWFLV